MPEPLEKLVASLRVNRDLSSVVEEAIRQGVILPVLARLGWDRDNLREVVPEFPIGAGRVDYCLKVDDRNAVYIEAKRGGEALDGHQRQLLEYAFGDGIELAVLTNGISWWFYLPLMPGSWEQRKFFAIDVVQQDPADVATRLHRFLGRDSIANGSAVSSARSVLEGKQKELTLSLTIPKAWNALRQEPDELLVELLADKVESLCGHKPDDEAVATFLADLAMPLETTVEGDQEASQRATSTRAQPAATGQAQGESFTGTKPVAYTFVSQRREIGTWSEAIVGLCEDLLRLYPERFDEVLAMRGSRTAAGEGRLYFSRDPNELYQPHLIGQSGIHVDTKLDANLTYRVCVRVLGLFDHGDGEFEVEVAPSPRRTISDA